MNQISPLKHLIDDKIVSFRFTLGWVFGAKVSCKCYKRKLRIIQIEASNNFVRSKVTQTSLLLLSPILGPAAADLLSCDL